jgi:hypothetical protein
VYGVLRMAWMGMLGGIVSLDGLEAEGGSE